MKWTNTRNNQAVNVLNEHVSIRWCQKVPYWAVGRSRSKSPLLTKGGLWRLAEVWWCRTWTSPFAAALTHTRGGSLTAKLGEGLNCTFKASHMNMWSISSLWSTSDQNYVRPTRSTPPVHVAAIHRRPIRERLRPTELFHLTEWICLLARFFPSLTHQLYIKHLFLQGNGTSRHYGVPSASGWKVSKG